MHFLSHAFLGQFREETVVDGRQAEARKMVQQLLHAHVPVCLLHKVLECCSAPSNALGMGVNGGRR